MTFGDDIFKFVFNCISNVVEELCFNCVTQEGF